MSYKFVKLGEIKIISLKLHKPLNRGQYMQILKLAFTPCPNINFIAPQKKIKNKKIYFVKSFRFSLSSLYFCCNIVILISVKIFFILFFFFFFIYKLFSSSSKKIIPSRFYYNILFKVKLHFFVRWAYMGYINLLY